MNISSLPFYRSRSSHTVSRRVSEPPGPPQLPHDHTRASSSREGNSRQQQLISLTGGGGSSSIQSNMSELPHIGSKRPVDWCWLELSSEVRDRLPPPSSLRKRVALGSRQSMRKQSYKMRGSDISEHIAMLRRKHLALERDRAQTDYEISSNCEEPALQEVPASPQLPVDHPSIMGLTATSSLHDYFTEQPPSGECKPLVAHTAAGVHDGNKQSLPEDIAYGFGLDSLSDIFEQNHEDRSILTEEDEQAWLFPAEEEVPLPLSLESSDYDDFISQSDATHQLLAGPHHQQSVDVNTPSPSIQEPSPGYLQPLSLSPPAGCSSFNPSTFSIQNYYPREE